MTIVGIIQQVSRHNFCYDKSAITLEDVLASQILQQIVLAVEDDEQNLRYVDLTKLYAEQPVGANGVCNWVTLEGYLSRLSVTTLDRYNVAVLVPRRMFKIIDGVKTLVPTPFASHIQAELNIYSVENNFGIDVAYGSHRAPGTRNNKKIKWNLPDLVFSLIGPEESVNFANTIPYVHGVACYPEVYKGELFAYQGAQLASKIEDLNKNIVLVDYSQLGNLNVIPLYNCEPIEITGLQETETHSDKEIEFEDTVKFQGTMTDFTNDTVRITFLLPEGTEQGYPLVCIGGRVFEPSTHHVAMYHEGSRLKCIIELDRHLLEIILAANLEKFRRTIKNTSEVRVVVDATIRNLFNNPDTYTGTTEEELAMQRYADKTVAFIAVLHSKEPLVHDIIEPTMVLYPDKLKFPLNSGGLLINKYTREVIDYVKIPYDTGILVTFPVQEELRLMQRDNFYDLAAPTLAIRQHNTSYTDKYNPFSQEYVDVRRLDAHVLYDLTVARLPEQVVIPPNPEIQEPEEQEPEEENYVPIITRLTGTTIHVEGIEPLRCGNYVLINVALTGVERVWKLANSILPAEKSTIVAYDSRYSCWYIGTSGGHLYESNRAHTGSSPWHKSVKWHSIGEHSNHAVQDR